MGVLFCGGDVVVFDCEYGFCDLVEGVLVVVE